MSNYENGKQTRQTIIQAARIFFWEKGYHKTRFEDFTKSYGINTGLIHYHFKKKEQIGREIYHDIALELAKIIKQLTGAEESLLSFVVLYELMWYFFDQSPQYAKFVRESIEVRIHSEEIKCQNLRWMNYFNVQYSLGLSPEELQVRTIAVVGGQVELIYSYLTHDLALDIHKCCRYDIRNTLHRMKFQDSLIEETISKAEQLMQQYSFCMEKGFYISFHSR